MKKKISLLPDSLPPRGLSREMAAEYVGVSPTTFDNLRKCGSMPKPKEVGARNIWDRLELDAAFVALDSLGTSENPWDEVYV